MSQSEEPRAFLAWCYEVVPEEMAIMTRAEVERRGLRSGKEIGEAIARIAVERRPASQVLDSLEELLDAPPVDSAAYVLLLEEYVTARLREAK
jgi:hypothetical protein